MLKSNEVGFVKPSINYGSVAGSSAKFFGQGILNLKKSRGGFSPPFVLAISGNDIVVKTGGLVNNIPALTCQATWNSGSFICVQANASAGVIQQATIITSSDFSQTATANHPPSTLRVPLYKMQTQGTAKILDRVIGLNNITAIPVAAELNYQPPTGCGMLLTPKYVWAVFA